MDVSAAIVNYGTPALTRRAIWSLVSLYPTLEVTVIDNNSADNSRTVLDDEFARIDSVQFVCNDKNVHHGPALDQAIRRASREWVLVFDSDCQAYRAGFIERMVDQAREHAAYMVGDLCHVDDAGFNTSPAAGHAYVHPRCALVHRRRYLELPPFEKHGAPCLTNQVAAVSAGLTLLHFPVDDFVLHHGRGTVDAHGYGLGWRSFLTARLSGLKRRFKAGQ